MRRKQRILGAAALSALLAVARGASAEVTLCVEVAAPAEDEAGFKKLVRVEVDKHPTHRTVTADCRSRLRVELFEAAGNRILTAQIDREVPMRFTIKDPLDLPPRVEEAIRLVLHNDPQYLSEDIAHLSAAQRIGSSLTVRGHFMFRMELFEAMTRSGTGLVTAPGAAFSVTRGSGHFQVFGRLYGGGSLTAVEGLNRSLQAYVGADGGFTYEFLDKAFWSPYLSTGLGIAFLRYAGRERAEDTRFSHVNAYGATLSARLGVRFFRWYNFDMDLFAQGYLPLFVTRDIDGALFGDKGIYTPVAQVGLGVGF